MSNQEVERVTITIHKEKKKVGTVRKMQEKHTTCDQRGDKRNK